jgi:hypothetical protein
MVIKTYKNLDKTPKIFFLPGEQVFPWLAIWLVCYFLLRKGLGLPWVWVLSATAWGIATWWILTWRGMHHFFSRFVPVPNWVRAIARYQPILTHNNGQTRQQKGHRSQ